MGGPMSGSKAPLAPEKGVFPLDHFGECKLVMRRYLKCLDTHGDDAGRCRDVSKQYLECRMERELMVKQDLAELGFGKIGNGDGREGGGNSLTKTKASSKGNPSSKSDDVKKTGFVGGVKSAKAFTKSRTT